VTIASWVGEIDPRDGFLVELPKKFSDRPPSNSAKYPIFPPHKNPPAYPSKLVFWGGYRQPIHGFNFSGGTKWFLPSLRMMFFFL